MLFHFGALKRDKKGDFRQMLQVQVGVIMGSTSDWSTMQHACVILDELHVPYEKKVVSAHRTPDLMFEYAETAIDRGLKVIIAGAGGAAHLPGMVASKTALPVIGVPVQSAALNGLDSLLSIVQMPGGVPVATVAIGKAGATNAGLLAAQILATQDKDLQDRLKARKEAIRKDVTDNSVLE
jgi:5-(carboxyamino)imidazole ribonucleotide mutase